MANKKPFNPKVPAPTNQHIYSAFIKDLLLGLVTATKLYDKHKKNQKVKLEYDDPNEPGKKSKFRLN